MGAISPILKSRGGIVCNPWWKFTNMSAGNCLAAWQPKGAASYAASKVNIVNPGTYDLSDGAAFPAWAAETGWTFTAANSEYLTIATAIATAAPLSIVCRFKGVDVNTRYTLVSIADFDAAMDRFDLAARGDSGGDPIGAITAHSPSIQQATTTAGFTAATWHTAIAVFASSTSRAVYLNAGNKGTGSDNITPANLSHTYIGANAGGSALASFLNGSISACAIYNIALSDVQVFLIHNAMSAL